MSGRPPVSERSEHVVEGPVFQHHDDDVINLVQVGGSRHAHVHQLPGISSVGQAGDFIPAAVGVYRWPSTTVASGPGGFGMPD
jgi:hypothetical protein